MLLLNKIEQYIKSYVAFDVPEIALPIALWIMGTHIFQSFDSFAYLVITSNTKRSGKTRLSEIISFAASSPMNFSAMTPSTLFRVINPDPNKYDAEGHAYGDAPDFVPPTIVFDEAEALSSEAAGTMRSVLNAGYRKGQSVPRTVGQEVIQFKVYCPKIFILIGDVYDTLRDRSIVINMKRSATPKRFVYDEAQSEGASLRVEIKKLVEREREAIVARYHDERITFLSDREEEIWLPIFALCNIVDPNRLRELKRVCVDISALKTATKNDYRTLDMFEKQSEQMEYAELAVADLYRIIDGAKAISSADAVDKMRDLDTSPWRTFRGKGIEQHNLADLLSGLGVPSVNIRFPRKDGPGTQVLKGYRKIDVYEVVKRLNPELAKGGK